MAITALFWQWPVETDRRTSQSAELAAGSLLSAVKNRHNQGTRHLNLNDTGRRAVLCVCGIASSFELRAPSSKGPPKKDHVFILEMQSR
jgi:hypothetical protein